MYLVQHDLKLFATEATQVPSKSSILVETEKMYYKEDNLAKRADSLQLKCSAASGEITICAVGVESCGDLISGSPPTGNRTGREPENQEVLSNSGKQIEVSKTEEAGQRTGNQSILVC